MFKRLYETHLDVADLERAVDFYGRVLELVPGTIDQNRRIAFYFVGGWNESLLGLWEKKDVPIPSRHLAFEVELQLLEPTAERLRKAGVELTDFFGRVAEEPTVFGWMPAASYYFYDVDGHQLEVLARIEGAPRPEVGVVKLREWQALA